MICVNSFASPRKPSVRFTERSNAPKRRHVTMTPQETQERKQELRRRELQRKELIERRKMQLERIEQNYPPELQYNVEDLYFSLRNKNKSKRKTSKQDLLSPAMHQLPK